MVEICPLDIFFLTMDPKCMLKKQGNFYPVSEGISIDLGGACVLRGALDENRCSVHVRYRRRKEKASCLLDCQFKNSFNVKMDSRSKLAKSSSKILCDDCS